MRLYDEIFKNPDGGALCRCIVVPVGGGYFQGVKRVDDFTAERVVLCFGRERVAIEGEKLSITKYYDGDLLLAGKIRLLQVLGEETSSQGGR